MRYNEKIYYCEKCDKYFTQDEVVEKEVDIESDFGVGGMFLDHHYTKYLVCPCCQDHDAGFDEIDDVEDIVELLNDQAEKITKLKEELKEWKKR